MIRSIPDINIKDPTVKDVLEAMKEIIEVMLGRRGSDSDDQVLTKGDSQTIVGLFEALNTGLSHDTLADVSANDHHAQAHTVASHSDTTATGAELETLTDDSMADTLHRHSELSASDGDPNPILSSDASGNLTQADGLYVATDEIRARDSGGLVLRDDSGTSGVAIADGGAVSLGAMGADINMDGSYQVVGLQAPAAAGEALRQTVNITEADLEQLTDGSDTTLHDHDGIAENTAARHTQGTDTALGAMAEDIDMNNDYQIVNLQAPAANGEAIRATAKITEAKLEALDDAIHTQGTDTALGTMTEDIDMDGSYQVVGLQLPAAAGEAIRQTAKITEAKLEALDDAIHDQGTDTTLGTMTADIDMDGSYQVVGLQLPAANGEAIRQTAKITEVKLEALDDAIHTQGTDTALGTMAEDIDMNNDYQIVNLQAPAANGEAIRATAKITEVKLEALDDAIHTQGTDTALGVVGTKNPPIDADKALYRDSTNADALVTSTWTQIKAFLKTYFDTLYNNYVHPNHTGEVTSVADGVTTIANDAVTYAKMQNVSATNKLLGRSTAGAGDVEEITVGGDLSQSGSSLTVIADAITYDKMQDVSATDKVLGRETAGVGTVEEITCTAFARSILDDADEATFKATVNLEIGTDVAASGANTDITSLTGANLIDVDILNFNDATELTIAAGAITITQSYHKIDTEADAASSDLTTISGGTAGDVIYLCAENDARTVVLKHDDTAGAGKILTSDGNDYSLDDDNKIVQLVYNSVDSHWRMVAAAGSAGGAHSIASHNDTTATGAELEALTNGSNTILHRHSSVMPGDARRPKFTYTETLKYDGGSALFVEGETVTGAGGATGVVVAVDGNATAGYLFINTRNATAYVNNEALTGSIAGVAVADGASTKDSIVLGSFYYHHQGTSEQVVYSDSKIGFRFGSGGSNAGSTNLAASDWFYLYLDDSAIVTAGTALITDSEIVAVTTEPTESDSKHGLYNGEDRCIFAVRTDSSSNIMEFFHDGDLIVFAVIINEQTDINLTETTWTDATLTIPSCARRARIIFRVAYVNGTSHLYWRTNGQSYAGGQLITYCHTGGKYPVETLTVITDSGGKIELYDSQINNNTYSLDSEGWYFSTGM